jgi:multidrug resistance efflux pump
MINEPRAQRWPWIVGLILLMGTVSGAGLFLNHTPGGDTSPSQKNVPSPPVTVCHGLVDVDPGVVKLYPVVPGRVMEVVPEGTEVKKGDILLKLDPWLAKYTLAEAEADLAAAKELSAQADKLPQQHGLKKKQQEDAVEAIKHQREAAYRGFKVKEEVSKINKQNEAQNMMLAYEEDVKKLDSMVKVEEAKLDELKLFDSQAQADINRAKADVTAKEARVDKARFALKECNLVAPCDGTILRVLTQVGEVLGANAMGPAIQFCPKGPKIIRAEVLQEWAYRVEAGQEVTIEDDTYAGATWQGRVKRVSEWFAQKRNQIFEPFMVNDVRTLECLIEVTSEGRPLRIGQRVRVKITFCESICQAKWSARTRCCQANCHAFQPPGGRKTAK